MEERSASCARAEQFHVASSIFFRAPFEKYICTDLICPRSAPTAPQNPQLTIVQEIYLLARLTTAVWRKYRNSVTTYMRYETVS
jgi:hypothetical protein